MSSLCIKLKFVKYLEFYITYKMKKLFFLLILMVWVHGLYAQIPVLIINNDATISINDGAKLVITNGNSDAITVMGTGGKIVSEGEANSISWKIGTQTGSYVIPFANSLGEKLPLIIDIAGGGVGSGMIDFSTYGGTWDNNLYRPSDVPHMLDFNTATFNNSAFVIDRFWIIDAIGYTSTPAAELSFTYLDSEGSSAGNTLNEANLKAQRFNTVGNSWGDMLPAGNVNTFTNVVSGVTIPSNKLFRSWTLVDYSSPLPIQLVYFDIECKGKSREIRWETSSEINNQYFTIEKSYDGQHFYFFETIQGAGNSNTINRYFVNDSEQGTITQYYRLSQTDFDGNTVQYPIKSSSCQQGDDLGFSAWSSQIEGGLLVNVNMPFDDMVNFFIYDGIGKIIFSKSFEFTKGSNSVVLPILDLATSIYLLDVKTTKGLSTTIKNYIRKKY